MKTFKQFFCASFVFVALFSAIGQTSAQEEAVFILSPDSGSYNLGDKFSVELKLDSSQPLTSLKSELSFDPSIVKVVDIDSESGVFTYWWEKFFDNEKGAIRLQASVPSPGQSVGPIATINFQAIKDGQSAVAFNSSSLALKPNDEDIFNLTASVGANFSVFSPMLKQSSSSFWVIALAIMLVLFIVFFFFKKRLVKKAS
ncbi:MAG: cohesin domain-containing protein [Candidatus Nealsonbacteria bacterium]